MTCHTTKGEYLGYQNNGNFHHLSLCVSSENSKWKVIKLLYINSKSKAGFLGDKCAKRYDLTGPLLSIYNTFKLGKSRCLCQFTRVKRDPWDHLQVELHVYLSVLKVFITFRKAGQKDVMVLSHSLREAEREEE